MKEGWRLYEKGEGMQLKKTWIRKRREQYTGQNGSMDLPMHTYSPAMLALGKE